MSDMLTTSLALTPVPFHSDTIYCLPNQFPKNVQIALKPTCESIGLDFGGQLKRLKSQPWATTSITSAVAADGKIRSMMFIDRNTFAMWLATIDVCRISNLDAANKIRLYQCEAAEVLDRHFFGESANLTTDPLLVLEQALCMCFERQTENQQQKNDNMRKYREPIPSELRWEVWERDDFRCTYCGSRRRLSVDHKIAWSRGGPTILENLVTACISCNSRKGTKTERDFLIDSLPQYMSAIFRAYDHI